jgi:hypothetical protein
MLPSGQSIPDSIYEYQDFNWGEFCDFLCKSPPQNPYFYKMDLQGHNEKILCGMLTKLFMMLCNDKYNKKFPNELTDPEKNELNSYFRSFGYNVIYNIVYIGKNNVGVPVNRVSINYEIYKSQ